MNGSLSIINTLFSCSPTSSGINQTNSIG